jgi:hypothetical protein
VSFKFTDYDMGICCFTHRYKRSKYSDAVSVFMALENEVTASFAGITVKCKLGDKLKARLT